MFASELQPVSWCRKGYAPDSTYNATTFCSLYWVCQGSEHGDKGGLTEKKLYGSISTLEWLRFEVTANLKFRFRNISAFKSSTKLSSQNSFVELSTGINQAKCFPPYLLIISQIRRLWIILLYCKSLLTFCLAFLSGWVCNPAFSVYFEFLISYVILKYVKFCYYY